MNNENKNNHQNLNLYGWNEKLSQRKQESAYSNLPHGRITIVHRTCYEVVSEKGMFICELSGNMMFSKSDYELPCVGDWVFFQPTDENKGIIIDVFARKHTLFRKKSGTYANKQIIASYIDKAFIVQSLDNNFNPRRAERFIAQILEENIKPILVLNKADLDFDRIEVEKQIRHLYSQMPVYFTSINQCETIIQLRESISMGETVVLMGSSGVGKSSLINALCEKSILKTSDISAFTGKGRHTSTRREMVLMKSSGILIDTPGVREFGLTIDTPEIIEETLEISDLASSCRFRNCTHVNEAGCAVIEAVKNGLLDRKVYESYIKLRKDVWHFSASEHEKRKKSKSFSKQIDEIKRYKGNV